MAESRVTVVYGKQSAVLSFDPQDPQALQSLKVVIDELFQLAPEFQRLLLRGRDVKTSAALADGCKLLLMRNRAFHESQGSAKTAISTEEVAATPPPPSSNSGLKKVSPPPPIDVNELDDDKLLVQVVRGKARYDLISQCSDSILDVKKKLSAVLGLSSPQALRLVVKGKTPQDDTSLETLAASKRVIKCMALLQAQQHVVQEKEEELRELLNDLTSAQAALQRVQRQMARNFLARDESLFELSRVLDEAQRVAGNLELVQQHLKGSSAAGPRASEQTLEAVAQALGEANTLAETAQSLLESHSIV